MNHQAKQSVWLRIWQGTAFLCHRKATAMKTGFGIFCFGLFASGCGKANVPTVNVARLATNEVGLVSIGVLNTGDAQRDQAIVRFFASNGVPCFIEGSVMFDVMVRTNDVERVHSILRTNPPAEGAFRSAWESR